LQNNLDFLSADILHYYLLSYLNFTFVLLFFIISIVGSPLVLPQSEGQVPMILLILGAP
jgi:hypothetical protein